MGRRQPGTGGLFQQGDYWIAKVLLRSGSKKVRKRWTKADAEAALAGMLVEFADELGYAYTVPHPYHKPGKSDRPRSGVTATVRFTILRRDDFTCRYCGAKAPDVALTVDHAISVADGGTDDPDNLVTACLDCNLGKGSRSVSRIGSRMVAA